MNNRSHSLADFHIEIWAELGDFTRPRAGFAGLATLATQTATGPKLRQMVLRKADRAGAELVLHTDRETPKVAEIMAEPTVSLLVWNPDTALQIRVSGRAEILGSYAAEKVWSTLPFASRGNHGVNPVPGTEIASADAYERIPDVARLAVIRITVSNIDAVRLAEPHHVRARFSQADDWAGQWVAP